MNRFLSILIFIGTIIWNCDSREPAPGDCGGHDSWVTFDNQGGFAFLDSCGVCDDDPSNDCIKDCSGQWGGGNICGCTDSSATNYSNTATYDDGNCEY